MGTIDFTEWTDAQLEAAEGLAHKSAHGDELLAELNRRRAAGTFGSDGSHDRIAEMVRTNPGMRGRRPRRSRRNPD